METKWFTNGPIDLEVKVQGEGPLILCVHGWPELWYSWRHQLSTCVQHGWRGVAPDRAGPERPVNVPVAVSVPVAAA